MRSTILVVDDEQVTAKLTKTFLERHGFTVKCAYDGEEALEMADHTNPDLILLDIMLPKMDGYKVCTILKSKEKLKDVPVLFFTAKGLKRDIKRGQEVGGDDYIIKPFSGRKLVERIREHLRIEEN
ncbi:MAG: response regulator transcription factor [Promethearchaeia archaeon]